MIAAAVNSVAVRRRKSEPRTEARIGGSCQLPSKLRTRVHFVPIHLRQWRNALWFVGKLKAVPCCGMAGAGTPSHRQRYGPGTTSTSCKHLSDICRRTSMTTTSTPGTVEASEVVMAHLARCSSAARAAELSAGDDPNVATALIEKAQRLMRARSLS